MEDYYIHAIPIWELAFYISVTLNRILKGTLCYRNGVICSSPKIQPEEILKKASGREELEFYYRKLCCNVY